MRKSDLATELIEYRCPSCKTYNKPYFHSKQGIAFCICKDCKAQYKTSTQVSANFRKFSSRHGKKPNKSPNHYSSSERACKKFLESMKLEEGLDFFHNSRVGTMNGKGRKIYYWLDFMIPSIMLVIEISPEIWHGLDGVPEKDQRKRDFLEKKGWTLIELKTADVYRLNRTKPGSPKRTKILGELDEALKRLKNDQGHLDNDKKKE